MAPQASIYDIPLTRIDGPGNKQADIMVCVAVPLSFAIATVIMRFYSRRLGGNDIWLDDWLMLPALTASLVTFGVAIWGLVYGNGKYIGVVTFGKLRVILTELFVGEIVYSFALTSVKFSIFALYWRLFPKRWVQVAIYILGAITAGWLISNTIVICLQCQPLIGFWDKTIPASCPVDVKTFLIGAAFVNVATDVAILAIPIYLCLRLQQSRINKWLLAGVFGTGFLVTIVSIVRLVYIFRMDITSPESELNLTWSFVDVSIWTAVEQNIAIVSGCLPCLKPILSKMVPARLIPSSLKRKLTMPSNSGGTNARARRAGSQNAWMKIGSWRVRSREVREYNLSDLLRTETDDTEFRIARSHHGNDSKDVTSSTSVRRLVEHAQLSTTPDDPETGVGMATRDEVGWQVEPQEHCITATY